MNEQNNPVDIGPEQIKPYKADVEEVLVSFEYKSGRYSLPGMILSIDPEEKHIMGNLERDTYLTIREGMQIFRYIGGLLATKVDLNQKVLSRSMDDNSELLKLREFCYNFATYASSLYISKKLEGIIRKENSTLNSSDDKPDLSAIVLDSTKPESLVIKRLLAPIFATLIAHQQKGEAFKAPMEFPVYVKDVFDKYAELALGRKDVHPELKRHIEGYAFRIMDGFIVLDGYQNKSQPAIMETTAMPFQRIEAKDVVGNQSAKRKIVRYVHRLALYDPQEQKNPILELGGLSWSVLFDGLPGTGKSSIFRLAMTLLSDLSEQIELPFNICVVDQSIKDEFYGKTGKNLLNRLSVTNNPAMLSLGIFDDIDLLTSSREDAQGADNDISNILMQYLDGAFTVRRGNVINFSATNKPTGIDDALRNRFNDRLLIDGPVSDEDFADMLNIHAGKLISCALLGISPGYTPFATQDIQNESGKWSLEEDVASYMAETFQKFRSASIIDFGRFMAELKRKNPRITGRSAKAIIEAVKERSANFDIPRQWFEDRSVFLDLPYTQKKAALAELYQKITPDILFQEAQRYFDSEERFADTEARDHVTRGYNARLWDMQSEIRFLEEEVRKGKSSGLSRLSQLKVEVRENALK